MSYTSTEIAASVSRIVRKEITTSELGTQAARDVVGTKNQLYDLFTISLLLDPEMFFYLIYMASNMLRRLVSDTYDDLSEIASLAPTLGRPTGKVTSTTALTNARAALLTLSAATSGPRSGTSVAVSNFRSNILRFIDSQLAPTLVANGDIQRTPEEVKARIAELWAAIEEREDAIVERQVYITISLAMLEKINLPSTALQTLSTNIRAQLDSITDSMKLDDQSATRLAFLDLMTMRSILTQATNFATPAYTKFPLRRESAVSEQVDSVGLPATLSSTGPYIYGRNTTIELDAYGTALDPTLPGTAQPELRTAELTFPLAFTTETLALVDAAGSHALTFDASYASGAELEADLNTKLPINITAVWLEDDSVLGFYGGIEGGDFLQVVGTGSAEDLAGMVLLFGTQPPVSHMTPVGADVVAEALNQLPSLNCTHHRRTANQTFEQTSTLIDVAIVDGTAAVSGAQVSGFIFSKHGARRGQQLWVDGVSYIISRVTDDVLELEGADFDPGAVQFTLQEDLTGFTHARVAFGAYQGHYAIEELAEGTVLFDRVIGGGVCTLYEEGFTLETATATTDASLTAGAGADTILGMTGASAAQVSTFTTPIALRDRRVVVGDTLFATAPSGVVYTRLISAYDDTTVTVSTPVPAASGVWSIEVASTRIIDHQTLVVAMDNRQDPLDFKTTALRLTQGAKYSSAYEADLVALLADQQTLIDALDSYSVPPSHAARAVIQSFQEQGLDRALDFLLRVDVRGFFDLSADGTSYSTHFMRTAAEVTKEVAPVSSNPRSQQGVSFTEN